MSITAIVTRHRRLFSLTSNSSDEIISHFRLQPAEKVELIYSPKNSDVFDTSISNWELSTLTRTSCLPKWFWRTQAIKQMHELLLQRHASGFYIIDSPPIIINDISTYHLRNTSLLLKNGHVHLHGHCSVLATGNATVTIHGSNNNIVANNKVQVISSDVGQDNIIILNDNSVLFLTDFFLKPEFIAKSNTIAIANGESSIEDYRYSTILPPKGPTIILKERSSAKLYNNNLHHKNYNVGKYANLEELQKL